MTTTVQHEALIGSDITRTIAHCISLACELTDQKNSSPEDVGDEQVHVQFEFNGVSVTVAPDSDPVLIRRDWQRSYMDWMPTKEAVGPYPAPVLTAEEIAYQEGVERQQEERRRQAKAEYEREKQEAKAVFDAEMVGASDLLFKDDEAKKNFEEGRANQDSDYGRACFDFARDWARLMQKRMTANATVADVAPDCESIIDGFYGITGFMYGMAVNILSQVWIHGDALRVWHNGRYGVSEDKEGVVNPAILTVGAAEEEGETI
jgi:hypothetical protein